MKSENDVFDKGKAFSPEFTHQFFGDRYIIDNSFTSSPPASLSVCNFLCFSHKISCLVMRIKQNNDHTQQFVLDEKLNSPNLFTKKL